MPHDWIQIAVTAIFWMVAIYFVYALYMYLRSGDLIVTPGEDDAPTYGPNTGIREEWSGIPFGADSGSGVYRFFKMNTERRKF